MFKDLWKVGSSLREGVFAWVKGEGAGQENGDFGSVPEEAGASGVCSTRGKESTPGKVV